MNSQSIIWKYATGFVVILIMLNPELIQLALFIDAVGLELFLMLFELQLIILFSAIINNRFIIPLKDIKHCTINRISTTWRQVIHGPGYLILSAPSQATIMHFLVFSAMLNIYLNP